MKRICIVGKNGYIASSFAKWLEKMPGSYAVDALPAKEFVPWTYDFSGTDVVVFGAGIAHRSSKEGPSAPYFPVNCDLAVETARKALRDGVGQFLYLSSMSVFGMAGGQIDRNTPLCPQNEYGRSKQAAEERLLKLRGPNFRVCILRPPMVYGKNCPGNYQTLRKLACKVPVFPRVKNRRSMIHIDNLCAWMQWAIDENSSGVLHPQDPFYVCTSEMIRLIAAVHGRKVLLLPGLGGLLSVLPVSAARKAFGSLFYQRDGDDHGVISTLEEAVARTEADPA